MVEFDYASARLERDTTMKIDENGDWIVPNTSRLEYIGVVRSYR